MATVYLAEDRKHRRQVAIKVLLPELAALLGADRFLREIEIAAGLTHPHILPLHDSGQVDGFLYYVMPYVEGASLRIHLQREHQLPIDEAIRITQQVASALHYAHGEGVVHRDIKPENVLVQRGEAMVADFGIALAIREAGGTRLTETGLSIGTPQYMSPEQASGERQLDGRSDLYALGCVCYEMLVGEPPFTGPTSQAIIAKVLTEEPPSIQNVRSTVPPTLEQAILRSLARLPADRPGSAQEFSDALGTASHEVAVSPQLTPPQAPHKARSYRSAAPWALVALFAAVALWGWARPTDSQPVSRFRITFPDDQALRGYVKLSPDGSALAYVGPAPNGTQLWVKERANDRATPLLGTDQADRPFFSPDGAWLGFSVDGALKKIPVSGGQATTLVASGVSQDQFGVWLDDGTIVFIDDAYNVVRVQDVGGSPEIVAAFGAIPDRPFPKSLAALPRGKGVLVTACEDICTNPTLWLLDLNGEAPRRILEDGGVAVDYLPTGHLLYGRGPGTVLVAPFDLTSLDVTGPAVAVLENVLALSVSDAGHLIYREATTQGSQIVWVERDGTAKPIDEDWWASFRTVALSPDGTKLAVSIANDAGQDLWVKQLDRGPTTRLTRTPGLDRRPTWMPDGMSVMFKSERAESTRDLYMVPADGRSPPEVVLDLDVHVDQGVWSRQRAWLVYRTGISGQERDIFALRPGRDSVTIQVPGLPGSDEHSPALSPDGRWLAYVSDESGTTEVYVRPFPNLSSARWQISVGGGTEPLWAHSGRELFFRSDTTQMVTAIGTAPTFSAGPPRSLFSLRPYRRQTVHALYDVTPDDQRFVMIQNPGRGGLIMVENFFEEMHAKLAAAGY